MTGSRQDDPQRHTRRLVSSLRARDGIVALAAACHADLPGVDGVVLAGLAAHAGRIILSESGPAGDQFEDLHVSLGEGPALDVVGIGRPIEAADLAQADARARWPHFAPRAVGRGIRAAFAFPVTLAGNPVAVLSLYRSAPGPLDATDHNLINRYTDAATVLLIDDVSVRESGRVGTALPPVAAEVQQAVGIVMEYAGIDAATALHRIRAYAHNSGRTMRDVVAEVRTCRLPFDPHTPT